MAQNAAPLRWLVPAYENPCCRAGPAMWSTLIAAAQARPDELAVIFNPHNGPGASPIDPNYVGTNGQGPLRTLLQTQARVVGYVYTADATRDPALVRADIARYYSGAYWRGLALRPDGVFFDNVSPDLANVGYYRGLVAYLRTFDANAVAIGNPGVAGTTNPTNQTTYTAADYGAAFDVMVAREDYDTPFNHGYVAPVWLGAPNAAALGFIAHGATTPMRIRVSMSRAFARGAQWLYVTDDVRAHAQDNPYDVLSTYWSTQVALVGDLLFADHFD
ncbi:spherulation-specific family 4 protein [Tahibacter soli]|uniref:Spherulation-specific family 4 protein n=1 Tax=Tahibacter soli TaxID=2983605 RepID=A0A9X4BJ87_9GAMM|nr:spherulation-specific family 4 protein [Tahibacter soli]MDC8011909.1 spherulation-specific family 4 protein [Tahibacter soli]